MSKNAEAGLYEVPLSEIEPWPGLNPRRTFRDDELQELGASIKADGLLQPVSAAPAGEGASKGVRFWLFVGERRYRASKLAEAETIRVLVTDVDEKKAHRLAGVENIDRSDLTVLEAAAWLERELELTGLSQTELADEIGRSQSWIANRIRLLALPPSIRLLLETGVIGAAHARDLLLRFLKLDADVQGTAFKAIAAELKKASKGQPMIEPDVRSAIGRALTKAKAVRIRAGYAYPGHVSCNVSANDLKAFKKAHAGRCVKAPGNYGDSECDWTFEAKAWTELVRELAKKQKQRVSTPKKADLSKVKLGPDKKPVDRWTLSDRYGHYNVIKFSRILDPSSIDPKHVQWVKDRRWDRNGDGKSHYVDEFELMYVGADAKKLDAERAKLEGETEQQLVAEQHKAALEAADKMSAEDVLYPLLVAAFSSEYAEDIIELLRAAGHQLPDDSEMEYAEDLRSLDIDDKTLRRVAGALKPIVQAPGAAWELRRDVAKKAEGLVEAQTEEVRKAWLEKHVPAGAPA